MNLYTITKPGWGGSIGVPLVLMLVGGLVGRSVGRPRGAADVERREAATVVPRSAAHGRRGAH